MSEVTNGIVPQAGEATLTPASQQKPKKPKLRERIKKAYHGFRAKHPKLAKTIEWTGRGAAVGGAIMLGRQSVKRTVINVMPITDDEPKTETPETPETEETAPEETTPTEEETI